MVFTRHSEWHEKITLLKGQGVPLQRRYWHEILGYNYRMDNLSASLGTAQLRKVETILANKRRIADRYRAALAGAGQEALKSTFGVRELAPAFGRVGSHQ